MPRLCRFALLSGEAVNRRLRDLVDDGLIVAVACLVALLVAAWWLP